MPHEPVVSYTLAQELKAAGAPQQAWSWWIGRDHSVVRWWLWRGEKCHGGGIAAYTLGEIASLMGHEEIHLESLVQRDGKMFWAAEQRKPYRLETHDIAVEALGRLWLWQLEGKQWLAPKYSERGAHL